MNTIGRFLEFSVHAPDVLESLSFYKSLGFFELQSNDIWKHKYAVVSDGEINIGLHSRELDSPTISFVQPDLAKHAVSMADHGFEFTVMKLSEEIFNELSFADHDNNMITMLEARTFQASEEVDRDSLCGSFFELTLPVSDGLRAARFWAPIAPALLEMREEPTMHMRFDAHGLPVGLSESIALNAPSLCFKCLDCKGLKAHLDQLGIKYQKFPGFEGAFVAIRAPEGTTLFVFDQDFLGESYEVDETGRYDALPI
jgi:hypothetical protein